MGDSYENSQQTSNNNSSRNNQRAGFRGSKNNGNRESGGFRIRLSDNEMKATRSIQEAFNLRSTVAVLGFAVRTIGQMLEEGKLDEFAREYRSQNPNNRQFNRSGNNTVQSQEAKPNPFARPEKPKAEEPKNEEDNKNENTSNEKEESAENSSEQNNQLENN